MSKIDRSEAGNTTRNSIYAISFVAMIWFFILLISPLSFVPVPWPDDSAFYFVTKYLFQWPPRYVQIPQAPFEPSYRIFSFNTMPVYPVLIGLGQLIGIDGSHLIKIWPIGSYILSIACVAIYAFRHLPRYLAFGLSACLFLDPNLRWASVLVRPESLIGAIGVVLVLGLSEQKLNRPFLKLDPVAWLLALGAYAHFNAIHLAFPVFFFFLFKDFKRLFRIAFHGLLLMLPWFLSVAWHFDLFKIQFPMQWRRLAVQNDWLTSWSHLSRSLFQDMGSAAPFHSSLYYASPVLIVLAILVVGLSVWQLLKKSENYSHLLSLGWLVGSVWVWHTKPEVWFTYYMHLALWTALAISLSKISLIRQSRHILRWVGFCTIALTLLFGFVTTQQWSDLAAQDSWKWDTYNSLIECIDQKLSEIEKIHSQYAPFTKEKPFSVWDPTFPDVTIELSIRHPSWELTRTNDFMDRIPNALKHGQAVNALVVPEVFSQSERWIEGPAEKFPEIQSVWMNWKPYFLYQLLQTPNFKPERYLCQRGKWQTFIYWAKTVSPSN